MRTADPGRLAAQVAAVTEAGGLGFHAGPAAGAPPTGPGVVRVGLAETGPLPTHGLDAFDILLTARADPPAPWVWTPDPRGAAEDLRAAVERRPIAAAAACQVLRMTLKLDLGEALALESLAYSMLLASGGFAAWRAANP